MNWILLPPWSVRLIGLLGVVLLGLAILRWRRERRGGGLMVWRALLIAGLVAVMLNPHMLLPRDREAKPKLIVLLDTSASMATRDVEGGSRFEESLQVRVADLEREFTVEHRQFDRDTRAVELASLATNAPAGDASDLATALLSAVTDLGEAKAQAGILVISDGRATTPGTLEAAQLALARSVPLWTWCVGGPVARRDLWIETAAQEALAFRGADVELAATLHADGFPNRSFRVEILRGDERLEVRDAVPDTNGLARIAVRVKAPASGEQRYVFRVAAQPEEAETANNERAVFLRSVGEKVRVLVAEGQPHWDTKFLVQSLKRDPHVELAAMYRLNADRHLAVLSSTGSEARVESDLFPRTAAAMNAFDVIVLGRGAEAFFDAGTEKLLGDFVAQRGGSVVFARGKPYGGRFAPLAKLEPVAWGAGATTSVRLRPTEAGRGSPLFDLGAAGTLEQLLERLPALDPAGVTLGEKPLAVVLASGEGADGPVLVAFQRYGQGKTLSLNTSGLWRWAFRETGQEESEAAYQRFWVSLLQWLLSGQQFLPGADVALTSARRYYSDEQPMQFLIGTRNLDRAAYKPRLVIASGDGQRTVEVEPRARGELFVAEAGPFPPGTYRVTLRSNVGQPAELTQNVEVVSASVEKRELSADPALMKQLAGISGGAVLTGKDVPRLGEIVKHWEAARQLAHRQRPLWDRWWLWAAMIGLLGGEWWMRRREGLL